MQTLCEWILSNAVAASLLAVLALAVSLMWRRRPALIHACWLLVLVKLLTPPLFTVPIPKPVSIASQTTQIVPTLELPPSSSLPITEQKVAPLALPESVELSDLEIAELFELMDLGLYDASQLPHTAQPLLQADVSVKQSEPALSQTLPMLPATEAPPIVAAVHTATFFDYVLRAFNWILNEWMMIFLAIAFSGSGLLLLFVLARIDRLRRLLRFAEIPSETVRTEFTQLCEEFALLRMPELVLVTGRVGPLLWQCWGKAYIVLPLGLIERISAAELRTVLAHELTHYRRGDHLWRYLELAALLFYWWLPFAWLASRRLRQAEEECCDAGVVASLPELAGSYASALVRSLSFATEPNSPCPLLTSGLGPVNLLKRRLTMMRERVQRRLGLRGWLMLLAVAGVVMPVGFTWASDDDPPLPPTKRADARPRREPAARGDRTTVDRPNPDDDDAPLPPRAPRAATAPSLYTPQTLPAPAVPATFTTPPYMPQQPMTGMGGAVGGGMGMMGGDFGGELRNNAEMAVKQAELEVRLRRIKMKQAESEMRLYEAENQRAEKARQSGAMPESEVMIARSRVELSKSNVELAQIEVERAELGLQQAKRRLEMIARRGEMSGSMSGSATTRGEGGRITLPADQGPSMAPGGPGRGGRGGIAPGMPGGALPPYPMQPGAPGQNPFGGPPGGGPGAGFGGGGGFGTGGGFGGGEGSGRGFQAGGGFGGGAGMSGASTGRAGARGGRSEAAPPADRGDDADPRDRHIQELERQLRDMRRQLEELRNRRPDGEANDPNSRPQVPDDRIHTMFENMDKKKNGKLSKEEMPEFFRERFADWDTNHDGFVTFEEFKAGYEKLRARR